MYLVTVLWLQIALSSSFALFFGFLLSLVFACVTTEETHRTQINFIPDTQMNAMGLDAYKDMLRKEKVSTNSTQIKIVTQVGKDIAKASGKNFAWESQT